MLSRRKFLKNLLRMTFTFASLTVTGCSLKLEALLPSGNISNNKGEVLTATTIETPKKAIFKAMNDIKNLTKDTMQGREAGTVGEIRAAEYISKQLMELGLKPLGNNGYEQVFTIPDFKKKIVNNRLVFITGDRQALRVPCVNLIGELSNSNKASVILLCAHYDHLGINNNKVYFGANDNASGVACVLDVLRRLVNEGESLQNTGIVAAFWSAEEMGFLGSKYFVKYPPFPAERIKAVINVDTIGNGNKGEFAFWSNERNNLAVKAVEKAAKDLGAKLSPAIKNGHSSDHSSFAHAGIPAVTLLAQKWLVNNHSIKDTLDFVDQAQVKLATDIVYKAVKSLA